MKNKYLILIVVVIGAFLGNLEAAIPNAAISNIDMPCRALKIISKFISFTTPHKIENILNKNRL